VGQEHLGRAAATAVRPARQLADKTLETSRATRATRSSRTSSRSSSAGPGSRSARRNGIAGEIGEGSILHATKALEHMGEKRWQLALDNLDRAAVGDMPEAARAELRRLRDLCVQHEQP
jgi:hypothetical protein